MTLYASEQCTHPGDMTAKVLCRLGDKLKSTYYELKYLKLANYQHTLDIPYLKHSLNMG